MSILNFVSQEQLDDLDDDPQVAFMQICNLTQRNFADQIKKLDLENQNDWNTREDIRRSFMNTIVASAKRFKIEPFASKQIPRADDWKTDIYIQFQEDLDHYVTQIVIENSFRSRRDSVAILPKTKDTILGYTNALRDCIKASTLNEAKREALLKRLIELEAELSKNRTNMLAVARVVFEVLSIPGNIWASYDVTHRLTSQLAETVAEAKVSEQAVKPLAPIAPIKELSPPRPPKIDRPQFGRGGMSDAIDDDIPF